jgi:hypothetical protein
MEGKGCSFVTVNGTDGEDDRKKTAMINGYKSSMKLYIDI